MYTRQTTAYVAACAAKIPKRWKDGLESGTSQDNFWPSGYEKGMGKAGSIRQHRDSQPIGRY